MTYAFYFTNAVASAAAAELRILQNYSDWQLTRMINAVWSIACEWLTAAFSIFAVWRRMTE